MKSPRIVCGVEEEHEEKNEKEDQGALVR